jgi:hypothetical protein
MELGSDAQREDRPGTERGKSDADYCLDAGLGDASRLQAADIHTRPRADTDDGHRLTSDCYFWLEARTNPDRASERVATGMQAQRSCYHDDTHKPDRARRIRCDRSSDVV